MKQLRSKILIGDYKFTTVVNLEINSSWDLLADSAIIQLPNRFKDTNENIVRGSSLFKRGDEVKIFIGYDKTDNELPLEFEGFISDIEPKQIMTVRCEDYMWKLKQKNITKYSKTDLTLKTLINDLLVVIGEDIKFEVIDTAIGDFQIENKTFVDVLQHLKTKYGITSWIRNNVLYCGLSFYTQDQVDDFTNTYDVNTLKFGLEQNVPLGGNNVKYQKDNDIRFVLKGVSQLEDDSKIVLYAFRQDNGDLDVSVAAKQGSLKTFTYYNLTEEKLKEIILRIYPNVQFEGMKGTIDVFGEPSVKHGDNVSLSSFQEPDFKGIYRTRSVKKSFGVNGYFQNIMPDIAQV